MTSRLHSTCQLADGFHWLLISPEGDIYVESGVGFETEEEALSDLGIVPRDS
ncbi:hypothetical protein GRI62_08170 [Erythrobacter arachoides]|uniref:Uncharacterized protein n=1 Tax=Aurantiacibacter arachoides TaxID=1850444 RepID=A0A844ZZ73_9SPHN|nr:hypothetical protein [Aurantiacibacter arachoides]MXO93581.1 hypothetical protein [Aurantiacibacter arachoides]